MAQALKAFIDEYHEFLQVRTDRQKVATVLLADYRLNRSPKHPTHQPYTKHRDQPWHWQGQHKPHTSRAYGHILLNPELVANRLDRRYDSKWTERMDRRAALRIRARSKEKRTDTDQITEKKPN